MSGKRVCVIGAGPSGMAFLYHVERLRQQGVSVPEVVCYEKQNNWGGLWNYDWRTGLDKYGEYVHGSMYRYLWSNGPKEASLEFPDYTFEQHYGRPIPSFPPREVLFDYIQGRCYNMVVYLIRARVRIAYLKLPILGRWKKHDLRRYIRFLNVVRDVKYNAASDDFSVTVKKLEEDVVLPPEKFDFVVVASGHYSFPNVPEFEGFDRFTGRNKTVWQGTFIRNVLDHAGRVMHSHDFRDAGEFKGRRLLVVGSSYSAEDIAMQTLKYGTKHVIATYRNAPMGFKWPKGIEERPLVQRFDETTAYFKDGSKAEVRSQ